VVQWERREVVLRAQVTQPLGKIRQPQMISGKLRGERGGTAVRM
jgi:hypothetical protein